MKILLVNNDKGWGGGQEQLKSLSIQLAARGFSPHFLCSANSPSAHNFSSMGFPVWDLWARSKFILEPILDTAALLRRERFDIVMVTREHDLLRTVLAWKLAFPFGSRGKLIMCYHTATARKQFFLGAADAVVCVSSFIRDRLLAGNPRIASPITILPNGIPVSGEPSAEKFAVGRQRRFFHGTGFPLIGMVGAFFKNQRELIEIIPLLRREFPSIKVALVGDDADPGLTGPIKEKAKQLGVADSVIFTGKVPHERLADVYFDLDLSASTFRNEGFGLVHLESMAAGTPVVAYNEGGQVDIFKGNDAGVLVEGGVVEFAAAVAGLLRDNERRFAMGHEGFNLVRSSFSLATMGRGYLDFFAEVMSS
ncbi:glycosyltransferase family 4 protein [Geotalea uraniireducens]|uniref:Glycosyl transferase, group 1 n=1 Tax=Geotalea uraniireducens (strain Rf4) TaxID=351605 RepID=A5G6G5_GEOUR|nr:glycosyltransferase family 4 protein [Geotalea uraniireducens]ABQ27383.1 glycosyl transferase, group 1 [Geotalea uraniireducens Rf4]